MRRRAKKKAAHNAPVQQRLLPALDLISSDRCLDLLDERNLVNVDVVRVGSVEQLACRLALVEQCGEVSRVECSRHGRHGDAVLGRLLDGPSSGSLLAGLVQDLIDDEVGAVLLGEDRRGDLDQVRLEFAGIPLGEGRVQLLVAQAADVLEDVVGLGDQLHVAVLDSIVNHLDVVAGAALSDVGDARTGVRLRRHLLEDGLDALVGLARSAGHHGRTVAGALLAAGHAHAHVEQTLLGQLRLATLRVGVHLVAAVDDEITGLEQIGKTGNDGVDGSAGLHQHDDGARLLQ